MCTSRPVMRRAWPGPLALHEIAPGIWLIVKGFAEDIVADATASRSRYCHGRSGQGGLGH